MPLMPFIGARIGATIRVSFALLAPLQSRYSDAQLERKRQWSKHSGGAPNTIIDV